MERGDFPGPNLPQRHRPEGRKNVTVQRHLVGLGRSRLAPDAEFDGQTAGRQIGDRGLGCRRRRHRILTLLDRSMMNAASRLRASIVSPSHDPSVTRFSPAGPRDWTMKSLRPVAWTRTPKPGSSRS